MYYSVFVNISLQCLQISWVFSSWLVSLTVTSHHCVFVAGRTRDKCFSVSIHALCTCIKESPYCANFAFKRTALENIGQYPEASKEAVLENFYMAGLLDPMESPERALNRSGELVHPLHLDGFKLTKFVKCAKFF